MDSGKDMNPDAIKERIEMSKAKETAEEALITAKSKARVEALAEAIAAGKAAFARGHYVEAEEQFTSALMDCRENRHELLCNRAACCFKLGRFADAAADAASATDFEPHYVKGHYRLACAQQGLGKIDHALSACRTALSLEPESAQLLCLLADLETAQAHAPAR